ncbi:MAG: phosphoribosylformylglycinamidine synthase subunit PurS [Elusimicrobiota bacterium]
MANLKKYKVEVSYKPGVGDTLGEGLKKDIEDLGILGIEKISLAQIYQVNGDLSSAEMEEVCQKLLSDTVVQDYKILSPSSPENGSPSIEIWYKKGVTDTVGESVKLGIHDLGIDKVNEVKTGQKYIFQGKINADQIKHIAEDLLANAIVNEYVIGV